MADAQAPKTKLQLPTIPLPICDVHTHLYDAAYTKDLEAVVARAAASTNVHKIVLCNENHETVEPLLKCVQQFPKIMYACLGIHPCCIESNAQVDDIIHKIKSQYASDSSTNLIAIGEIGLDFTPKIIADQLTRVTPKEPSVTTADGLKELQRTSLEKFIQLANELQLPINVHSRSAGRPCVELLLEPKNTPKYGVLLHCFDGSEKVAKRVFGKPGFYFSIPSCIVRSDHFQKLAKAIPLDQLVLETDSPALVPELDLTLDASQRRNEPMNVALSAQKIAEIKNISLEQVCKQTTENAKKLFPRMFV